MSLQEVHRGDLDQLRTEVHRHGQEADHAHVVEARQPADHDVGLDVVLGADEHRLGVGVDVAVGDVDGFGRPGGSRRQLHQRQIVLAGLHRVDRFGSQKIGHREDRDALFLEHRNRDQERVRDHHGLGLDHADDVHGVLGPHHQVGARCRLVQHGQARPAHPQRLRGRGDLHRRTGEHADSVARVDARGSQSAGNPAGALMHFTPGMTDRLVRFARHHALRAGPGVVVHLVGESAHEGLHGFRSDNFGDIQGSMLRL